MTRGWARSGIGRFLEHVLSESDPAIAAQQKLATQEDMQSADWDGCRVDRRTLQTIQEAG